LAHIGGADVFARSLLIADKILSESQYNSLLDQRYASFGSGKGQEFTQGKLGLADLFDYAKTQGEPKQTSGKQEMFENLLNQYL
jgi:xylose isomerase